MGRHSSKKIIFVFFKREFSISIHISPLNSELYAYYFIGILYSLKYVYIPIVDLCTSLPAYNNIKTVPSVML